MPSPMPSPTLDSRRAPSAALADVLRHPGIWQRAAGIGPLQRTQPSGHAALDAALPGGGWPLGALTEILVENDGLGELDLLMPALAALTARRRRVALIAPPYLPYPPALACAGIDLGQVVQIDADTADGHWSAEQCLRAGCCAAVLHWLPTIDYRQLRRLQLAAEAGDALAVLFRPAHAAREASPATLRILVSFSETGSCVEILKCRGNLDTGATGMLRLRA